MMMNVKLLFAAHLRFASTLKVLIIVHVTKDSCKMELIVLVSLSLFRKPFFYYCSLY